VSTLPPQPETLTSRAAARRVERILLGGGSTAEEKVMAASYRSVGVVE
jgi:hypothetical protein